MVGKLELATGIGSEMMIRSRQAGEEKLTVPLRSVEQLVHIVYGSMSRLPNAATVSVLCDVSAQSTSSSGHSDGQP